MLQTIYTMKIDRPIGSSHPRFPNLVYPVHYGYIPNVLGGDHKEQDVYLLGISEPISEYTGKIIAIIERKDDVETKWVMCPISMSFTKEEIQRIVDFQEKYFHSSIVMIIEKTL